jgi:hypothetical protein
MSGYDLTWLIHSCKNGQRVVKVYCVLGIAEIQELRFGVVHNSYQDSDYGITQSTQGLKSPMFA